MDIDFKIVLIAFIGVWGISRSVVAQQSEMLLYEIAGNRYERQNFDKSGKLASRQVLNVGSITEDENQFRLPVEIIAYNREGTVQDTTRTIYKCNPEEQNIFVNIFPYSDYGKGGEIKVKPEDTSSLYPVNPGVGWQMKPIHFEMHINKGLVGFLGGKSKIKMYNRRVVANDTLTAGEYEINSSVNLGVYVMGIKVKGLDYRVSEVVDRERGLIYQKFRAGDGSYFVIQLQ